MIPVKLPEDVLTLFPTWEHRCPRCNTYVEVNSSFCPKCKTAFNEKKWRVPPRFLKSYEAMSEYAHKVLAPKLTAKERELLFKYFTEMFSDGFESGDFSEWTETSGSPAVSSAQSYSGSNSMYCSAANEYAYTTIGEYTTLHSRCYVRVHSLVNSSDGVMILDFHVFSPLWGSAAGVMARNVNGTYTWGIWCKNHSRVWSTENFNVDTWYCVELKYVKSSSDAEIRLYVADSEILSHTGENIDYYVDDVRVGFGWAAGACEAYFDCVVVADTYIGPETAGQTYTKTWSTDVLFEKLGIPKTFSVDSAFQKQDSSKTFGVDSAFQKNFTLQKQIDSLFKKLEILETFGVDVDFLKGDVITSFAVDARFSGLMAQIISRQIDVLLKKLDLTKSFGLDAYFGQSEAETYAQNFALDAIFAYRVRLPELWLDENGKLVMNISKPYTWVGL